MTKRLIPSTVLALLCTALLFSITLAQTITATVTKNANLRAGASTTFAVVGTVTANQRVTITGRNATGDWYQLADGKWIAAFLVTNLTATPPVVGLTQASVTKIIDGDTIEVTINGASYPVRYIGIQSPEAGDPGGAEASEANRKLVSGQVVTLEKDVSETDRFGRLLRYVYLADGRMINEELIKQGAAFAVAYPPDTRYQTRLSAAAKPAQAGQGASNAIAPSSGNSGSGSSAGNQPAPTPTPQPPAAAPAAAAPASGSVDLRIVKVDKRAEFVVIQNFGAATVNLAGWHLLSVRGAQQCTLGGEIGAGAQVVIYAMTGSGGFECKFGSNIWNNSEDDDAVLINPSGQAVSQFDS